MELVLSGLTWKQIKLYLDDVIAVGKTFWEALCNLALTFHRCLRADLVLKSPKCSLFQKEVSFLGHVVTPDGISCDPEKLKTIQDWKTPHTLTEVRSFIGFCAYYRKFIDNFSTRAGPLYNLYKKSVEFEWTDACEEAFQDLKVALMEPPVLAYPEPGGSYLLDTDASNNGLGAVLSQIQDGDEKVISYWSRTLHGAEKNYCTTYLELLAVKCAIMAHKTYLWGQPFTVRTDHASLTWLLNFKAPDGLLARWIAGLSEYNITSIVHRAGRLHVNADVLSRPSKRPCPRPECWPCQQLREVREKQKGLCKRMVVTCPIAPWIDDDGEPSKKDVD